MLNEIQTLAKTKMDKSIGALKNELSKLRTGRAHPSLLEHVQVDYYGTLTPLNQVASVAIADSRTLSVTPWEKSLIQAIEKAIMTADLGLNPIGLGNTIKIPMPALTEDRRKELIKVVKNEGENSKVGIRNIRRDLNTNLKELLKDKSATEDEVRKAEQQVQTITNNFIKEVDNLLSEKEKDLMSL